MFLLWCYNPIAAQLGVLPLSTRLSIQVLGDDIIKKIFLIYVIVVKLLYFNWRFKDSFSENSQQVLNSMTLNLGLKFMPIPLYSTHMLTNVWLVPLMTMDGR